MARLPEAEVVLVRSKTKCTAEWIAGAPKLKLIIRGGVGLDNVDAKAAKERGIEVRNTPAASSVAVAELAFAPHARHPQPARSRRTSRMKEGKFLKKEIKRTELFGKTLGLVGVGRIGTEVAKRAAAFGMKVLGLRPVRQALRRRDPGPDARRAAPARPTTSRSTCRSPTRPRA